MVDLSNEMNLGGFNFLETVNTIKVALKSLPVGSKFNICSFGHEFSYLFGYKSKVYNEANIEEAILELDSYKLQNPMSEGSNLFPVIDQMITNNTEKEM